MKGKFVSTGITDVGLRHPPDASNRCCFERCCSTALKDAGLRLRRSQKLTFGASEIPVYTITWSIVVRIIKSCQFSNFWYWFLFLLIAMIRTRNRMDPNNFRDPVRVLRKGYRSGSVFSTKSSLISSRIVNNVRCRSATHRMNRTVNPQWLGKG
jgi:hypothetical protein